MLLSFRRCRPNILLKISKGGPGRRAVSHQSHDAAKVRNIALVAHIDSGKTTLTESILLTSGYVSSPGTVDTGSTTTDFLPAERQRGITIQSASIPVRWKGWTYNLIDTPGHADFGMEVESASRVVDGAVVLIDSVEGVEAQTKGVWRQLDRYGVPTRLLFLNKMDRTGSSVRSSFLSLLQNRLHRAPMLLTLPVSSLDPEHYKTAEPGIHGIVDLVKWEVWLWDRAGESIVHPLPRTEAELEETTLFPPSHPLREHLLEARTGLLDGLSMYDDNLMEVLLSSPEGTPYLDVGEDKIISSLRRATLNKDILPVICGSAFEHKGTHLVLDYVGHLLASPPDVTQSPETTKVATSDPVQMLAWKVTWDKRKGWMTFIRVYSGSLTKSTMLHNTTRDIRERISKLLLFYADQPEEVEVLPFGSVGVILGLKHTRTGDTLVAVHRSGGRGTAAQLRDITPPPAVMSASIIPYSQSEAQSVQDSLHALARTDPSIRVETADGQLLMHGLGTLHLEIAEGRLRDEWNVDFETGPRKVGYRETFEGKSEIVEDIWSTEVQGRPMTIHMRMEVSALTDAPQCQPGWDGNAVYYRDGEAIPHPDPSRTQDTPIAHISRGIAGALSASPSTGLPLSHICVRIHKATPSPGADVSLIAGASNAILRKILLDAGIGPLMEPYVRLKISVDEDHFGRVMKELTENSAEILELDSQSSLSNDEDALIPYSTDGLYVPPDWLSPSSMTTFKDGATKARIKRTINATAPLSRMLDFSTRLRALSGGNGTLEVVNDGFRRVNSERQSEILQEIGRA